jgi:nickel-type superoxide dismutase maturation protease
MRPALRPGDRLLVRWRAGIRPGDVVVARRPDRPTLLVLKRAVHRAGDGWWLAGDDPAASDDSRLFGPVADDLVVGRVLLRWWPPWPTRVRRRWTAATRWWTWAGRPALAHWRARCLSLLGCAHARRLRRPDRR